LANLLFGLMLLEEKDRSAHLCADFSYACTLYPAGFSFTSCSGKKEH
jgi:hypothetical protein